MITYDEHKRFLARQMDRAQAEYLGFCAANSADQENPFFTLETRAAFDKGLADGLAKLMQATVTA